MARDSALYIGPHRKGGGSSLVTLGAMVLLLILSLLLVRFRWIPHSVEGFRDEAVGLLAKVEAARAESANDLAVLRKQVSAILAVERITLMLGPSTEPVNKDRVEIPYDKVGSSMVRRADEKAAYYIAGPGESLGDIASRPDVLGCWYLWPVLAEESKLPKSAAPLADGTLIRIPSRLGGWQLREATTQAGAPDAVRDEVFRQADLKP